MGLILSALKLIGGHLIAFAFNCIKDAVVNLIMTPVNMVTELHTQACFYSNALTV